MVPELDSKVTILDNRQVQANFFDGVSNFFQSVDYFIDDAESALPKQRNKLKLLIVVAILNRQHLFCLVDILSENIFFSLKTLFTLNRQTFVAFFDWTLILQ